MYELFEVNRLKPITFKEVTDIKRNCIDTNSR